MNWAWWDGKMTLHHYRDEHGLDTTLIAETSEGTSEGPAAATAAEPADAPSRADVATQPEDAPEVTGTKHGH